jgi:hypothetical protein
VTVGPNAGGLFERSLTVDDGSEAMRRVAQQALAKHPDDHERALGYMRAMAKDELNIPYAKPLVMMLLSPFFEQLLREERGARHAELVAAKSLPLKVGALVPAAAAQQPDRRLAKPAAVLLGLDSELRGRRLGGLAFRELVKIKAECSREARPHYRDWLIASRLLARLTDVSKRVEEVWSPSELAEIGQEAEQKSSPPEETLERIA